LCGVTGPVGAGSVFISDSRGKSFGIGIILVQTSINLIDIGGVQTGRNRLQTGVIANADEEGEVWTEGVYLF